MKLDDKGVKALRLPEGKSELIVFDDKLPGLASGCALAARAHGSFNTASAASNAARPSARSRRFRPA